jgi:galactonate dehydratase
LKIKDIRVHFVQALWRNFVITRIETDDGLIGFGEGTMGDFEKTIEAGIMDYRPHLIGREIDIPEVTEFLHAGFFWRGGPILMTATSAIEQALWDIVGKATNKPVWRLLGGRAVDRVRVYANGFISGSAPPEEYARAVMKQLEDGFGAVKFDPFGGAGPEITASQLSKALDRVRAVREAAGPDVQLLIEAEGRFDPKTAIKVAAAIQKYDPTWLEEPIPEEDIAAMAYVRSRSPVPIATGERVVTKARFMELLSQKAADIIQPDVCHVGGIRALTQIAAMAETQYVTVAPHNPNGPIATASTINAMATMPNALILEFWLDVQTVRHDLIEEYFEVKDSSVRPSEKPGLGIVVNEKALTKYPYKKLHVDYYSDAYKYHGDIKQGKP